VKIAVLANGAWDLGWGSQALETVDYLICADGGANHASLAGRLPDLLIGDLDSVTPHVLTQCENAGCRIKKFPCEKDETDLELALNYAEEQARLVGESVIWLYGATGKRIDHLMGNLALMLAYARKGYQIRIVDSEHEIWVLQSRGAIKGSIGQEISLIALSEKAVVSTEGLYYPLKNGVLLQDSPRGISNVFVGDEAVVDVHSGFVLVVLLK